MTDIRHSADSHGAPAVSRMLDMIELMAENLRPYGINEIARDLSIPVNSAFRILKCLESRGYVESGGDGTGYRLSTSFFTLGMKLYTRFELHRRSRPHLESLSEDTGETSQINVPRGDRILVMDVVTPAAPFFLQVALGAPLYYHANAMGKVALAFMPDEAVDAALRSGLPALTPYTITDRDRLNGELIEIRRSGIAHDREEYNQGVYCVGAPVFDPGGEVVAGVGITGLVSRFRSENLPAIEARVLQCAEMISWDVGYRGDLYAAFRAEKDSTSSK